MTDTATPAAAQRSIAVPAVFAGVVLAWASNWPVMRIAIAHVDPTWLAAIRFLITVPVVALPVLLSGRFRAPRRGEWSLILAVGILQMAAFTFLSANALRFLPAGPASVVAYSTPLWVAPAAALLLRERIGARGAAAAGLAVLGIVVLAAPAALGGGEAMLFGIAMRLAASLAWSVVIIVARRAGPPRDGLLLVTWQALLASALLVPAALLIDGAPDFSGEAEGAAAIAFVGVFATAFAFIGTLWLASRVTALTMSVCMLSVPVLAILLSSALLGEVPGLATLAGLGAILAGVGLNARRRPQASKPSNPIGACP